MHSYDSYAQKPPTSNWRLSQHYCNWRLSMDWQWFFDLLKDSTFWTAIGALATLVASGAILYAARQFRFEAWNKAQDVFIDDNFTKDRQTVFQHIGQQTSNWTTNDLEAAFSVCRKIDELCRLAPFFGKKDMIRIWRHPIGQAWALLHAIVQQERDRTSFTDKWDGFKSIGSKSFKRFPTERQNQLIKLGQEFGKWAASAHNTR
jgi:hypothetical protein